MLYNHCVFNPIKCGINRLIDVTCGSSIKSQKAIATREQKTDLINGAQVICEWDFQPYRSLFECKTMYIYMFQVELTKIGWAKIVLRSMCFHLVHQLMCFRAVRGRPKNLNQIIYNRRTCCRTIFSLVHTIYQQSAKWECGEALCELKLASLSLSGSG